MARKIHSARFIAKRAWASYSCTTIEPPEPKAHREATSTSDGVPSPRSSVSADVLRALSVPYASEGIEAVPVGPWVSNARNEGPRCLEPAGA
jgi:hypothetical protein